MAVLLLVLLAPCLHVIAITLCKEKNFGSASGKAWTLMQGYVAWPQILQFVHLSASGSLWSLGLASIMYASMYIMTWVKIAENTASSVASNASTMS